MALSQKDNGPDCLEESREVIVENSLGLHARPASQFVQVAKQYSCDVAISRDGHVSDGKSIIGVLMLGAGPGTKLRLLAKGEDANEALDALEELFRARFGEE